MVKEIIIYGSWTKRSKIYSGMRKISADLQPIPRFYPGFLLLINIQGHPTPPPFYSESDESGGVQSLAPTS